MGMTGPGMLRTFARACRQQFASAAGVSWWRSRFAARRHQVLMFHRIRENNSTIDEFDTCPSHTFARFSGEVERIARQYEFVPLLELPGRWHQSRPLAAITFDDGWRDNFDLAYPYLSRMGLPATLFVTTNKIGQAVPFWQQLLGGLFRHALADNDGVLAKALRSKFEIADNVPLDRKRYRRVIQTLKSSSARPPEILIQAFGKEIESPLKQRCFVDEREIKIMANSCFTIGSHSCSHSLLDQLSVSDIRDELVASKNRLEALVGRQISLIAYPNGNVDQRVRSLAAEVGYRVGCTTESRYCGPPDDTLLLPRIEPQWDS